MEVVRQKAMEHSGRLSCYLGYLVAVSFVELHADGTPAFVFPLFARWIRDYQS